MRRVVIMDYPRHIGIFAIFLGGAVLIGWAGHIPLLVQVSNSYPAMQFNTALTFIFLGTSFLFLCKAQVKYSNLALLWPLFISVATLLEYGLKIDLKVDQLFFKPYSSYPNPFPGRMGSNTAFCFLLLSITFFAFNLRKSPSRKRYPEQILGLVCTGIALSSIICSFGNFRSSVGWGNFTQMALHTAVGLALLGLALPVYLFKKNAISSRHYSRKAIGVFVFSLTGSLVIWQVSLQREEMRVNHLIQTIARNAVQEIEAKFRTRLNALYAMSMRSGVGSSPDKLFWELDSKLYLKFFPDIRSIGFVDSDYRIQWIYPLEGNEASLGRDLSLDPVRRLALEGAKTTGEIQVTPPIELFRGGRGVVAFLPVIQDKTRKNQGMIACSFRLSEIFDTLIQHEKKGDFLLEIFFNGKLIQASEISDREAKIQQGQTLHLSLFNQPWELRLTPLKPLINKQYSFVPVTILLVGIIVTFLLALAVQMVEVTSQKMEEVEIANRMFKSLLDSAPDATIIVNGNGKIHNLNKQAEKLFGYKKDELIGKPVEKLVPAHLADRHISQRQSFFKSPHTTAMGAGRNLFALRKDSTEIPIEISLSPLQTEGGTLVISSVRDITQRLNDQSKLRQQEAKFASAAKMAALGEMASGIGHEINNPLSVIRGTAEDLKDRLKKGGLGKDEVLSKLDRIEITSCRIEKIIRGLRSFAREDSFEPLKKVLLSDVVEDTLALCSKRFKSADVDLTIGAIPKTLSVSCRSVQISQVLLNLLNNAFDAVLPLSERWIRLEIEDSPSEVRILITDSGKGIDPEIQSRIMQPFFSTKEPGRGSGLGLSISKGIVESHFGSLTLNIESRNTQFVIRLPKSSHAKTPSIQPPSLEFNA